MLKILIKLLPGLAVQLDFSKTDDDDEDKDEDDDDGGGGGVRISSASCLWCL